MKTFHGQVFAVSDLISAYRRHLRAESAAATTITVRTWLLQTLHDALPFGLAYASTEELDDFLGRQGWKPWTRRTYGNHIRAFYRWADGRWLEGNPAADMAKQRKPGANPRPVSDDELAHALAVAPDPWHTAIVLAAHGGLRRSELAGIFREDITEEATWIRVAKGGDPAYVDTHPAVWELVRDRPRGQLLIRATGRPVTPGWLSDNERTFFDSIGLMGVTLHRFRHWFATALLDAGNDLRTVQEAMRHKSVSSTECYTKVAGGQRRLAIRSLPAPTEHPDEH